MRRILPVMLGCGLVTAIVLLAHRASTANRPGPGQVLPFGATDAAPELAASHTIPALPELVQRAPTNGAARSGRRRPVTAPPVTSSVTSTGLSVQVAPEMEKARLVQCAGHMPDATRAHVTRRLRKRLANGGQGGTNRFAVVGASASRAKEFLTGFASQQTYRLANDWAFLQPTIDWFSHRHRKRNSFARKGAAVSGTTAGNWIWKQKFCLDCPEKLEDELRLMDPAFALVMFGTNNVSWGGLSGYKGYFKKWIAAGYNDRRCRHDGVCLPPYELGDISYPDARARRALPNYITSIMSSKRRVFRVGYTALLDELLERNIVPIVSTIPPMPRRWLDEDTVVAMNEEIRALAAEYELPIIDFWCALNPTDLEGQLDWTHPVMTNNKGIGKDRYHPQEEHAFDVDDEYLVHGYLARNILTLLRLSEMRDLSLQLMAARDRSTDTAAIGPTTGGPH